MNKKNNHFNKRHILALYSVMGFPANMVDFGCGDGSMVEISRQIGIDAFGIDLIENDRDYLFQNDLNYPVDLGSKFQLVLSLEVAEHIKPESTEIFCETLSRHAEEKRCFLVFSAACPGQSAEGHINIKQPYEWRTELYKFGFMYDEEKTRNLSLVWSNINSPYMWLAGNVQVFKK